MFSHDIDFLRFRRPNPEMGLVVADYFGANRITSLNFSFHLRIDNRKSPSSNLAPNDVSSNVTLLDHPLAAAKLSVLRAQATPPEEFRQDTQELSMLLLAEAARGMGDRCH